MIILPEINLPSISRIQEINVRIIFFIITPILTALIFLYFDFLGPFKPVAYSFPVFTLGVGVIWPKIESSQKDNEIQRNAHFFLSYLGILSTSSAAAPDIFKIISERDGYGYLSIQSRKIHSMVENYNQQMVQACKRVGEDTPNDDISSYLERLALNLEAGVNLEDFMVREQDIYFDDYISNYEGSLDDMDTYRDLFIAILLSSSFMVIFSLIIPTLIDISPNILLAGTLLVFLSGETMFTFAMKAIIPYDPIWHNKDEDNKVQRRIKSITLIGFGLTISTTIFTILMYLGILPGSNLPLPLYVAIPITPLAVPGAYSYYEERKVKKRDKNYPSFLRALGSSETIKQGTAVDALEALRKKDFGEITVNVRNLYKRLNTRISRQNSWEVFTTECGSYLIQRFSDMYIDGRMKGSNAERIGDIIGDNFEKILRAREKRARKAISLIGTVYGVTASVSFAFYVGLEMIKMMIDIIGSIGLEGTSQQILSLSGFNMTIATFMITVIILINATIASILIKISDGGSYFGSLLHFVGLVWIGVVSNIIASRLFASLIPAMPGT